MSTTVRPATITMSSKCSIDSEALRAMVARPPFLCDVEEILPRPAYGALTDNDAVSTIRARQASRTACCAPILEKQGGAMQERAKAVAERLRVLILEKGWNQSELARRSGMRPS